MILHTPLIGRFGNALFQYAHARRLAELKGATLSTPPWIGEQIFDIPFADRSQGETIGGYRQSQSDLIYSRKWILDNIRLKPHVKAQLDEFVPKNEIVAHLRRGDYVGYGYPIVSKPSYLYAAEKFGFDLHSVQFISEELPLTHPNFTGELAFLPDFYRLMCAKALFRGNSSFSWWASALGEARTFSPCIKGKPGGVESFCEFSEGNHEQFAELPNITDLHLFREEQRYEYDLKPEHQVYDIGVYNGDFAVEINSRYGCYVDGYEACLDFAKRAGERTKSNSRITIYHAALGKEHGWMDIRVKGDMTGAFADGDYQRVTMVDAECLEGSELLKLNCEGGEYDILERLIRMDDARHHTNIQVQFHSVVPDYAKRYATIREELLKTHRLTYDEPYVWQNFELRS